MDASRVMFRQLVLNVFERTAMHFPDEFFGCCMKHIPAHIQYIEEEKMFEIPRDKAAKISVLNCLNKPDRKVAPNSLVCE